jgi:hypothetical protein
MVEMERAEVVCEASQIGWGHPLMNGGNVRTRDGRLEWVMGKIFLIGPLVARKGRKGRTRNVRTKGGSQSNGGFAIRAVGERLSWDLLWLHGLHEYVCVCLYWECVCGHAVQPTSLFLERSTREV